MANIEIPSTNSTYTMVNNGNNIVLTAENEVEEKLLSNIENTVSDKINRLSKTHNVKCINKTVRDRLTLGTCCSQYIEFQEQVVSKKTMLKYKQAVSYLYVFFGEKKQIKGLTTKDTNDFRNFLLKVPKNYKGKKELKDKDIKKLVESKSKILDQFEKQELSTVDEVIKRTKTIFAHFVEQLYIYSNPFQNMKKLANGHSPFWREFKEHELIKVFKYLTEQKLKDEFNFLKFTLYTGFRRGETLQLTKSDIYEDYIDTAGVKTENAKRIMPIHKDIVNLIKEQLENKSDTDLVFFNGYKKLSLKYKDEKVGTDINEIFKKVLGEDVKKYVNIHSLRKNFSQEIFLSDLFKELDYKTLIGHSTSDDTTDKHYLLGKRNYKKMKEKLDIVDFSHYFKDIFEPEEFTLNF
jgi:integrase